MDNDDGHLLELSIGTEMDQIDEYNTFRNMGRGAKSPSDHQRIRVHFVFYVKHDLRRKSCLVAGGHMTAPPNKDSVYSGVVTLRSLILCMLLGELNGLDVNAADVGNAYLMAYTKEKLYIIAGPEFGDQQGCLLIIVLFGHLSGLSFFGVDSLHKLRPSQFHFWQGQPTLVQSS
jgi:hypothetical protein